MIAKSKKQELISMIDQIQDEANLDRVQSLLEEIIARTSQPLTPAEKAAVDVGRKDFEEGKTHSFEDVDAEIKEWLGKEGIPSRQSMN